MSTVRNATARDRYLDVARDCIIDIGWRGTTLTEVARRADVSRMTIYRIWSSMSDLLGDVLTREWAEVGDKFFVAGGDMREVAVAALVHTVTAMRHNALYRRILELDPEVIMPYLFVRRGRVQEHLLQVLRPIIDAGQQRGDIRRGNPDTIARALMLTTQGFLLSAGIFVDDTTSEDALDEELTLLLDRALRP